MQRLLAFIPVILFVVLLLVGLRWYRGSSDSNDFIWRWLTAPQQHPDYVTQAKTRCGGAPFIVPSEGFIGLLWRDPAAPYNTFQRHTGMDIFGAGVAGTVPIYAVYDGYATRLADWRSTIIIRHDDPLQPGRTIWTYYTHMANRDGTQDYIADDFPPGTTNRFVEQGTLLGYQGTYSPGQQVAMHLHFSIVMSGPNGSFLNEAVLENTLDPSPYFGLPLNINTAQLPVQCAQ